MLAGQALLVVMGCCQYQVIYYSSTCLILSTSLNERDISAMFFVIMGLIVPVIGLVVP